MSLYLCPRMFPANPSDSAMGSSPFAHSGSIESHYHGSMRSRRWLLLLRGLFSGTRRQPIWTRCVRWIEQEKKLGLFLKRTSAQIEFSTLLLTTISPSMMDSYLALIFNHVCFHSAV